jgi:imidazolonepropionase-like amidohydrolase
LEYLAQAGIPKIKVLEMATRAGAETMGLGADLGMLTPGMLADVIAVSGDPLSDLSVLRDVNLVIKGGAIMKQKASA